MMRLHRFLLGAVLALVLNGCAAGPGLVRPATGVVDGHVMVRACGGAYREDQAGCRISAAAGAQLSFRLVGGVETASATTDRRGAYRVDLRPGTYQVDLTLRISTASSGSGGNSTGGGVAGPKQITVTGGKTVHADFTFTIQLL